LEKESLGIDQGFAVPFQNLARIAVLAMDFAKWLFLNSGRIDSA